MSTQEQSFWGVTRRPRPSTALPAPVTAVVGSAKLGLAALLTLAGGLNLWALSRNGWANTYYSAAVRSMSSSWHDFLFGAMDRTGVMTVDKPPLALWVQWGSRSFVKPPKLGGATPRRATRMGAGAPLRVSFGPRAGLRHREHERGDLVDNGLWT